ncbi:MAG TPA: hypothetical protein VKE94_08335 [Gemmataceae bacterium]|nr:hypothetical protein [Gemmataceae bacterium]
MRARSRRRAGWTPQAQLGRGLLLTALLVVPNVALWLGYRDGRPLRALCNHGRPAAARVLHKSSERRGKPGAAWLSLTPGRELAVLYDPERPGRHRPLLALTRVRFLPSEGPGA